MHEFNIPSENQSFDIYYTTIYTIVSNQSNQSYSNTDDMLNSSNFTAYTVDTSENLRYGIVTTIILR